MTNFVSQARRRNAFTLIVALFALLLLAGCGDDKVDGSETGKGAPPGASGEEAGGFSVEAGKQRDPKDAAEEKQNFSSEPPPIQILSGNESGYRVSKPTVVIAKTQREWRRLSKKHFSRGVRREDIVQIDYKSRQAIALFMPRVKPGILVIVTDVFEKDGKIIVKATRLLPGKGCKTKGYGRRPFHMVETRKMQGEVDLNVTDQKASGC